MSDTTHEYNRAADQKRLQFITDAVTSRFAPGAKILDVGCGNGVISRHLGSKGFNVLGIDVSAPSIARANELNRSANTRFEVKSAEELVAAGESFDVVICSEVLEHLQDPDALLRVLYQSLKDEGILVVTVPNGNGPRELLVTRPVLAMRENNGWAWKLIVKLKKSMGYSGTTVQSAADNLDHVQFFSRKDLSRMSAGNRFRIVQFGKANFVEDVFPFSFFTKKLPALQRLDCKLADVLPAGMTGGFFTVWEKHK